MKSSKLKLASIILAVVLCLLVLSAPAGAVVQPNSDFYVLDNENVLSAETERYIIDRNLNLVSNCKGAQVCVVVTDSTNGQDIEEYATELFNAWGIGSKTEDNGVLILFLTDDDNYWIMPGIGLERVLTERVLRQIIDDDCEPSFARKDYDSAAKATFIAINQVVCNYYSQDPNGSGDSDKFPNNNGNNYYPDDHPDYNSGSSCLSCGSCLALSCAACGSCGSCSGGSFMGIIIVIIIVFVFFKIIASIGRGGRRPPRPPRGGGFGGGSRRANNGPRKGNDRFMQMRIDFMDAIFGKTETINIDVDEQCKECGGSGAYSSSDIHTCSRCNGTGYVTTQSRTMFGVVQQQSVCPECGGTGKKISRKCTKCGGRGYEHKRVKLDIKIPAGIQSGQQVRVSGKGERGINGGPNGDLYIEILVTPHKVFQREGNDIHISVPVSAIDATLGCKVDVPTVYGDVSLSIPAGTQHGTKFRLKGKGVKSARSQGDEYVEVQIEIPTKLNHEERELYEKIRSKKGYDSPFERFKRAFK